MQQDAAIRPYDTARKSHDTAGRVQGRTAARAHAAWLAGESRYNGLYRGLGRPLCRNMGNDTGCDMTQQRPATRAAVLATRHAAGARVVIQFLYRDQKGRRYDSVRAATRQGMFCDTTPCAPRHKA